MIQVPVGWGPAWLACGVRLLEDSHNIRCVPHDDQSISECAAAGPSQDCSGDTCRVRSGAAESLPQCLTGRLDTGAILKLRCEDVDLDRLPHGWIQFRAEHDKTGHEQWVPITEKAIHVLREHRLQLFDSEWLFPSERVPDQPVDHSTMDRRLRTAYEKAELKPLNGGLWHPWRRKWATERPFSCQLRRAQDHPHHRRFIRLLI